MSQPDDRLNHLLASLAEGARRHATRDAATRAGLALACVDRVADVADVWARTAVTIKQGTGAVLAEEIATGPLATLRLLLLTARALVRIAQGQRPQTGRPPRIAHAVQDGTASGGPASLVEVDVLPVGTLLDGVIFAGNLATVRCVNPGGLEAFDRSWRREIEERPCSGGVAVVLGAGNVTGLSAADVLCQIFEYGRATLLKLHPLHAPLESVLAAALAPLVEADLLRIVSGGAEIARAAVTAPVVTHVHLTGGQAAFQNIVWGDRDPHAPGAMPQLSKPITCELGNVTPWIVVPGRYTSAQLACQADTIAASIANNTSFNCIATKLVVTCRTWRQREAFLALVSRRLASLPARPAWYPGSTSAWETIVDRKAPADGTLPWVFRTGLDLERNRDPVTREWFVPVAAETMIDADDLGAFFTRAARLVHTLPGSLAANVTIPATLPSRDRRRADMFVEHLEYGVVAVNSWSATAYAFGNVPWGGFPGGTLASPGSGIGRVHDPWMLPLVHNTILRSPLTVWPPPPWFPWHAGGARLARGLLAMYASIARGGRGLGPLVRMLPDVLRAAVRPSVRP